MNRRSFLIAAGAAAAGAITVPPSTAARAATMPPHKLTGIVVAVGGNVALIRKRNGSTVTVDFSEAAATGRLGIISPGVRVIVFGTYLADGTFHGVMTAHAAPDAASWEADR